jgi:hypothetical protein
MQSYQFSQFVNLCNSHFEILFEVVVLRIYWVTCYIGSLISGPYHSSNQKILAVRRLERVMVHLYGNHISNGYE